MRQHFRWWVMAVVVGVPGWAAANAQDQEPNNTCQTAQSIPGADGAISVSGSLDTPPETPDVDFFRFTLVPGAHVRVSEQGQASGQGTLHDPLLGIFDSQCNLLVFNDDSNGTLDSQVDVDVPEDGVLVVAASAFADFGFEGLGSSAGSYLLQVAPFALWLNDVRPCDTIPAHGGACRFSYRVQNQTTETQRHLETWAVAIVAGLREPQTTTVFQVGQEGLSLPSLDSDEIGFTLRVPGSVPAGAVICVDAFVGQDRFNPRLNPRAGLNLFCVTKEAGQLLATPEAAAVLHP